MITSKIVISEPIKYALGQLIENSYNIQLNAYHNSIAPQGYRRVCCGKDIILEASDEAGMMYAIIDLAGEIKAHHEVSDLFVEPYIKKRGIKFNIPLDARTPSYSDASTSATKNIPVMWEFSFWQQFLDSMANNKYNVLSLWTLSPFPSLVKIPEFPNASIKDVKATTKPFHAGLIGTQMYTEEHKKGLYTVKRMSIDDKINFWRSVMQYAKSRCIEVYLFTWNIFVYGTEDSGYNLEDKIDSEITKQYVYSGTKALLRTYPLLAGIGVTAGENMKFKDEKVTNKEEAVEKDIYFIRETYGKAIDDYLLKNPDRKITLIHRLQMSRYDKIVKAYKDFKGNFEMSFKYSQAHMYSSTKPIFINKLLKEKSEDLKIWLTVRNDDYYMCRWGDPRFAKEYILNMPLYCMSGFYMGPDGFTWGRDFMTRDDDRHPLVMDKMWYMFEIWGQLSYNINLNDTFFITSISLRFHIQYNDAIQVYHCWKEASSIIPEFNCVHWHDLDFQWYPEGCCMYKPNSQDNVYFADINEFIDCPSMPGSGYVSVKEYVRNIIENNQMIGITPLMASKSIKNHALVAEQLLSKIEKYSDHEEFKRTCIDIRLMSILGYYYAIKEEAAVDLQMYKNTKEDSYIDSCIEKLVIAASYWRKYSSLATSVYIPQVLTRYLRKIDLEDFNELADLDCKLAEEYKE